MNELNRAVPLSPTQALYPTTDLLTTSSDPPSTASSETPPPASSEPLPPASSEPLLPVSLYRQRAYTASELAPSESPHRQEATSLHYIRVHTSDSCLYPTIIPPKFGSGQTAFCYIQRPTGSSILRRPMVSCLLWHSAS